MKRFRIWIRELSLSQQLLSIIFIVVTVFVVFFFVFLTENINDFVRNQMYVILHRTQDNIAFSYKHNVPLDEIAKNSDQNLIHIIYSDKEVIRIIGVDEVNPNILKDVSLKVQGVKKDQEDHTFTSGKSQYLYSIMKLDSTITLATVATDNYRNDFKNALVNNVINANVIVVGVLFVILMLWVGSLIHPLNLIRNYIDKISKGEKAELSIDRRDEIGEVAEALVSMRSELQRQDLIKEQMIQNISHDLKTPIATIKSYGESIKDGIYPYETLEKSVDVIIEHAERLEKKVYSLIMLNKMGYLQDTYKEVDTVDMHEIIEKVMLSLKVIRPELIIKTQLKRVYFHGEEDPWRVVVENLMDNAIRYAATTIEITLDEGIFKIKNDGPHLSSERMAKMFKPYEKGTDGKFGLGLSIVYRVVNTYGYKVNANNLNEGVLFVIEKKKEV